VFDLVFALFANKWYQSHIRDRFKENLEFILCAAGVRANLLLATPRAVSRSRCRIACLQPAPCGTARERPATVPSPTSRQNCPPYGIVGAIDGAGHPLCWFSVHPEESLCWTRIQEQPTAVCEFFPQIEDFR